MKQSALVVKEREQKIAELLEEVFSEQYDNFRKHLKEKNLTSLDLAGKVIDKDLRKLGKALQGTLVTTIILSSNQIKASNARDFIESLEGKTALSTINLGDNLIGIFPDDPNQLPFTKKLQENSSVKILNLSFNSFDCKNQYVIVLGEGLKGNTSLTTLNLNGNLINDENAVSLIQALKETKVASLYLRWNRINAKHLEFIECFKDTSLKEIDLVGNPIESNQADLIAPNIKNASLVVFNINAFSKALTDALKYNKNLINNAMNNTTSSHLELTPGYLHWQNKPMQLETQPQHQITTENSVKLNISSQV